MIGFIVAGLIIGALARLFTPGKQKLGLLATLLLGLAGSVIGGTIAEPPRHRQHLRAERARLHRRRDLLGAAGRHRGVAVGPQPADSSQQASEPQLEVRSLLAIAGPRFAAGWLRRAGQQRRALVQRPDHRLVRGDGDVLPGVPDCHLSALAVVHRVLHRHRIDLHLQPDPTPADREVQPGQPLRQRGIETTDNPPGPAGHRSRRPAHSRHRRATPCADRRRCCGADSACRSAPPRRRSRRPGPGDRPPPPSRPARTLTTTNPGPSAARSSRSSAPSPPA